MKRIHLWNGKRLLAKLPWAEEWIEPADGPIYGMDVVAETDEGIKAGAYVVVWVNADEERPYRILDWQEPPIDDGGEAEE